MQIGKELNNMRYMFEMKYIVFSLFIMMYITVLFYIYQSITLSIVKEENIVQLGREQKYYEIKKNHLIFIMKRIGRLSI